MNTQKIISCVENPSLLGEIDITDLEKVVSTYPFFAAARILLTKKMQQSQHLFLKKEIKKTAVSVPNRKLLYEILYQKDIHKSIQESQIATEASVTEVIEPEVSPIVEEIKTDSVSSFTTPVEIAPTPRVESSFSKPINLKDFGAKKAADLDILEQQIIGQTIEHVLSFEIENQKTDLTPTKKNQPKTDSSQKFSEWLTILDEDRLKSWRENPANEKTEAEQEANIIDSFLKKDINIISPSNDETTYTPSNLARLSVVDDEGFVTETLANIYVKQGNLSKALLAYKKLLLKYPEKKTYFAARIEEIEKELK
jgi:hypothetical protein